MPPGFKGTFKKSNQKRLEVWGGWTKLIYSDSQNCSNVVHRDIAFHSFKIRTCAMHVNSLWLKMKRSSLIHDFHSYEKLYPYEQHLNNFVSHCISSTTSGFS